MATVKKDSLQLESVLKVANPLVKMERVDWIGVDNFFYILPYLVDLVNNLKIGIIQSSCLKKFKFENQARLLIYYKYLIHQHGRIQYLMNIRSSSSQQRRMMRNKNAHYYLLILLFYNFIISSFFILSLTRILLAFQQYFILVV